jgi:hypothetical protein
MTGNELYVTQMTIPLLIKGQGVDGKAYCNRARGKPLSCQLFYLLYEEREQQA